LSRSELNKKITKLKNLDFNSFSCKHKPLPIVNGKPLLSCFCHDEELNKLYDECYVLACDLGKINSKIISEESSEILEWLIDETGWCYQKYDIQKWYPKKEKKFTEIRIVRTEKYIKEAEKNE